MKLLLQIILIIAVLISGSCREELEVKPNDYTKLLTGENSKTWKLVGIQYREFGKPLETYDFSGTNFCDLNEHYTFYANFERRFVIDEGPTKCDPELPDIIVDDSWSFVNANATLEFVIPIFGLFRFPWVVQELEKDRLVTEIFFGNDLELSYRVVFIPVNEE